ncbi:MAG TPA: basic amino acid ABC transporter substrate-binding protein [Thermoanaerobacterales bacterium]|jgi:ABC-type amino acid transport substrate-binding protein|nr:basic amino acid ABC transporter substrate-binding protein [Thermoanaerobacterales bacterium]
MKKLSKIIVCGLCLMLVLGLVAGCGQQQAGNEQEEEQGENQEDKKVLVVGTSPDYPPFEFVDDKGNYVGYDMDLIREIGKRLGMEIEIKALEFDSLIASVKQGKLDAVISAMGPTPERLAEADFTDPYYAAKQGVLVKPGSDVKIDTIEDLLKYNFAVQTGTTMHTWASEQIETGAVKEEQVKCYTDVNVAVLDLKNGRVDALFLDLPVAWSKAKEANLEVTLEVDLKTEEPWGIVVQKGNDELKEKLNGALKELKEDGTLDKLEEKWIKQ